MNHSPQKQAIALGVTESQVRAGLKRNANSIRNYSAADLKRWGVTRRKADFIAAQYEMTATK